MTKKCAIAPDGKVATEIGGCAAGSVTGRSRNGSVYEWLAMAAADLPQRITVSTSAPRIYA